MPLLLNNRLVRNSGILKFDTQKWYWIKFLVVKNSNSPLPFRWFKTPNLNPKIGSSYSLLIISITILITHRDDSKFRHTPLMVSQLFGMTNWMQLFSPILKCSVIIVLPVLILTNTAYQLQKLLQIYPLWWWLYLRNNSWQNELYPWAISAWYTWIH